MSNDRDLIKKIFSLPERKRFDFIQFFDAKPMSRKEIDQLEKNLFASIAMKNRGNLSKAN